MTQARWWTKKDFELVADILKSTSIIFMADQKPAAKTMLVHIAVEFGRKFHADNPQFDVERFTKACGIND